jgi:prepilin-type N-terminal cleavage/methylation domain-containing protein
MSILHLGDRRSSGQRGFTLIEIVIAMGVGSIIILGGTSALYQVFSNNSSNTAHVVAVKQVESALHSLERDVQMAQTIRTDGMTGSDRLVLGWVEWNNTQHTVTYRLVGGALTRVLDAGPDATLAQHITTFDLGPQPYVRGSTLSATITCTVAGWRQSTETRTLQIIPRSR